VATEAAPVLRAPAWPAELDLSFARRGERTVVARRRHHGPLMIQRAFYPEADGTCHVYVLHPPGGVVGGDELSVEVEAQQGASVLLTTPAATKLYRTANAPATLRQKFRVREGASLEWLPQETIAFGGSHANSRTLVLLDAGARYLGWEITCLGRPASNDAYASGSFRHVTEIRRGERLLLVDRTHVSATGASRSAAWGFGGRPVYATLVASGASEALVRAVRENVTPERPGDLFSVTAMSGLLVCRFLGSSAEQARRTLGRAWSVLRPKISGKSDCPPRIWTT
jgi:urease accessory protein